MVEGLIADVRDSLWDYYLHMIPEGIGPRAPIRPGPTQQLWVALRGITAGFPHLILPAFTMG
jgi:hypothetical protein